MSRILTLLALAPVAVITTLGACSGGGSSDSVPTEAAVTAAPEPAMPQETAPAAVPGAGGRFLTLEGLGPLRLGQTVPEGSSWAERGAQASETCRTVTSPDYPGVYAIVEQGKVRRISAGEGASVKTIEGIGPGSTRKQVDEAFPGFRESQHKYVRGGKDLIAPNAPSGDPAVRLELSPSGKVTALHVGVMPALGYVEGCS